MKQKRLKAICDFLSTEDNIIDIGCDHAYVCIEMARRGAKKILATDIHPNALESAKKNIAKTYPNQIQCQVSDGLKEIDPKDYNTLILAGMGANTIKHILKEKKKLSSIKKIIIQANNEWKEIRIFLNKLNFSLTDEVIIHERKHDYIIMKWEVGEKKLSQTQKELGIYKSENIIFYQSWNQQLKILKSKIPKERKTKHQEIDKIEKKLQQYIINAKQEIKQKN